MEKSLPLEVKEKLQANLKKLKSLRKEIHLLLISSIYVVKLGIFGKGHISITITRVHKVIDWLSSFHILLVRLLNCITKLKLTFIQA